MRAMRAEHRAALALAAASFAIAAPIAYVAQRLIEVGRSSTPFDPTLVLSDAHTAFYWRAATATWWGGLVAMLAYALAARARSHDRAARWLGLAAIPLTLLLVILAWRLP